MENHKISMQGLIYCNYQPNLLLVALEVSNNPIIHKVGFERSGLDYCSLDSLDNMLNPIYPICYNIDTTRL